LPRLFCQSGLKAGEVDAFKKTEAKLEGESRISPQTAKSKFCFQYWRENAFIQQPVYSAG
jgi:hypothetical protein